MDERSSAVQVATDLPAPESTRPTLDLQTYRIGPSDTLAVSVFGAPELDREATVDAAGNFSMPLTGSIPAAGKTSQELADAIAERLRGRYLKNPRVAVNLKEAAARTITVDGAVRQPGVYPVGGTMTLQRAIATAKGVDDAANIQNIVVFRTVGGKKMAAMFNLRDIRAGRYADPQLYPDDIIVVGESGAKKFMKQMMNFPILAQFIPLL
ncbi:MAG: polysaccharide biosynthesis/export family protein [Sphingomicrobium sp.]